MKLDYRPEIDGLRTIAVLAVIFYHTNFVIFDYEIFKGGFIGVDIFFVISGYLISLIIFKELSITGTFSFKNFYERRIRRILPPLLLVMLVFLPISWRYLLPINFVDFSKSILYSLGFSSNYFFWSSGFSYGDTNTSLKPFLHTWSLSVEEQFYILFPIILLFIFKFLRKYLLLVLILGFLISLLLADYGSKVLPNATFYFIPTRGWELLAGCILAHYEVSLGRRSQYKKINLILPSFGLILILHSIVFFNDQMSHPSFYTLSPVIGICIIIWFSNKNELITQVLSSKLFVGLGLISYSLYLWHYPILVFDKISEFSHDDIFRKTLIGLSILILSIFSYYFIERPFRNKKNNFKKIISLILFSSLILIMFSLFVIKNNGFKSRLPEIISSNLLDYNFSKFQVLKNENLKNKTVFLVGDSQMESLQIDLKEKIYKNNYNFDKSIVPECLFFPGFHRVIAKTGKKSQSCSINYYSQLENKLINEKNSILIFGGRLPVYLTNSFFDNGEGGVEDKNPWRYEYVFSGKFKNIQESFKISISKLSKNNQIILIYPIPEVGWHISQKFFNQYPDKIISTSYKVYRERTKTSFKLLDSIKGRNIFRVYPHKIFCNTEIGDRCVTHDKDNIFYLDHNHLSLKGAEMLNELILTKIKEIE